MKNRKRALVIAIVCLAVAAVLYLLAVKFNQKEASAENADDSLVISSVDSTQITSISYEKDGQKLSFIKEDGTWYDADDKHFPLNQDSLTTMTNTLGAVSATRKLENPEQLSEYGLDSPVMTVRYTASDNKEAEFMLGSTNDAAGGTYLKMSGDDAVYLVSSDFAGAFQSDIYQMADMESFPTITSDNITDIAIHSGSQTLEIKNDSEGGRTVFENGKEQENCAESSVTQLVNTVTGITFKSHVDYDCKDLSKYGLDQPIADISVDYTATETVSSGSTESSETEIAAAEETASMAGETETEAETIEVSKQLILHIGSQNVDGDYYAALDGSSEVHVISADTVKELIEKKASDFIDNTIISESLSHAKSMDITIGSDSWQLVKKEVVKADATTDTETTEAAETETEAETEEKWYKGDTEIALTDLSSAYGDLSNMSAEKILDTAAQPSGDQAISITIKWEDDTETTVSFTPYDSSFQLASVNGETRKLVNKRDVEKLVTDMTALLQ